MSLAKKSPSQIKNDNVMEIKKHHAPHIQSDQLKCIYSLQNFTSLSWLNTSDHAYVNIHLIERSIALFSKSMQGDLLDVGCGSQPYRIYFNHVNSYTACDFDASKPGVDFVCPAHDVPKPDESYDCILCAEVLEHVPDPNDVAKEFHRLLRPGGIVLLTTPMYWPSHEQPYDYFRYPSHGLTAIFERNGFEILNLVPRGGVWAFLGQTTLHCLAQYYRIPILRRVWNRLFLFIDSKRLNTRITLGWTLLARKKMCF